MLKTFISVKTFALGATLILTCGCGPWADSGDITMVRSLTGQNYSGKKYYFGWGAAGAGDPSMMHNEVKYDVLHTHDVFTNKVGGDYIGTKEIGTHVRAGVISNHWQRYKESIRPGDMYVQYSSGHGFQNGLGVGVTYDQMRDNALALGAKETVIFTMACHSGGLINSFKRKQAEIDRMRAEGKTLFVMASSTVQQLSSTGPGRDRAENGPSGSAGSAFGHALWKALSGEADGEVDGVKDGLIDLSEIEAYTKRRTQQIGGHTPVSIGVNYEHLIMNQIPSRDYLDSLRGGTEGMSETEIAAAIEQLEESELAASEL